MNKTLNYILFGLFFILLIIFGFTFVNLGFMIVLPLLLIIGLILSISKINEATKGNSSIKAKIYFSFIYSLLIFSLILFFWALGSNILKDEFLVGSFITIIVAGIGFLISLVTGIILSIKRKDNSDYNLKSIILLSTISFIVLLFLSFYNPSVSGIAQVSNAENMCYLTLSISDNSAIFNSGYRDDCFVGIAGNEKDISICKKIDGALTGCYIKVATALGDTDICKRGADEGILGMDSCVSIVLGKICDGKICDGTVKDMVNAVQICEKNSECNSLVLLEKIIFSTLKNPNDVNLIYAIKATKYMWREGQKETAIPLLRNLLTSAPVEARKAAMDSLIYLTSSMSLENEKVELGKILPLIETQSALSSYTATVKQRLSAQRIV